jgi:pyruvate dehydrogenase E2 component (dihydrolipoamide acetyltransferase)
MAEVILMPRLSDTMTEGVIAAWHKKVGDAVKKGELLAEIETDKATMDLDSYKEGTLLYIGVQKGEKLQVDDLLAILGEPGENIDGLVKSGGAAAAAGTTAAAETAPAPKETSASPAPAAASTMDLSKAEGVILMPRLSDTMTEGVIAAWHKQVGDKVSKGDVLAEIETDKATMDLESYKNGTLLYIGAQKGEKVPVNALLCVIGEAGSVDLEAIKAAASGGPVSGSTTAAPAQEETASGGSGSSAAAQESTGKDRLKASPLARKLAAEKGINLQQVQGSGDGGRIVKSDIETFQPATAAPAAAATSASAPAAQAAATSTTGGTGLVSFEDRPVSQMRKVIARRLAESKFTAPHFYLTMSIDMDKAVASRAQLNELAPVKISFNDMVLKAVAIALKQHPVVNSSWLGDIIRTNHHVNIGVAVAVDEGLLVPVVRNADTKGLAQIAAEVKDFAGKAKAKKLQPSDWEGSTFTISNLGMFGIDEFTAIINPPDSCILAVGAIQQVPVVKNGAVVPGNVMKVTLSCDHRVVDGASGSAFLQTVKGLLEEPLRMLI